MKKHYLTWDLGGTKCIAGLIEFQSDKNTYVCLKKTSVLLHETSSLYDLIEQLESRLAMSMRDVDAICIGAAGQYNGYSLILENGYPYEMPFAEIAKELNWPNYAIIHDYATVLCGTFTQYLYAKEFVQRLNSIDIPIFERRVAFGVGTGLGGKDGFLLENGDFWLGTNELGFLGLPAILHDAHPAHISLLNYLQREKKYSCVFFETILSGLGLQLLHQFLYPTQKELSPADIGYLMQHNKVDELTDLFAWYLGLFVATLQLTFMPKGGIWMAGGIILKHLALVKRESFQKGMTALPAYWSLRETHPLGVLYHADWALIGAAFYANKRLQLSQYSEDNLLKLKNKQIVSTEPLN